MLSTPEPKDPQDHVVAKMLIQTPREFERKAQEWAWLFAGAPKKSEGEGSGGSTDESLRLQELKIKEDQEKHDVAKYVVSTFLLRLSPQNTNRFHRYDGYNKDLIDRFCSMGFDVDRVVSAFKFFGIDRNDGEDYELEEAYMGDVTARLLGEP